MVRPIGDEPVRGYYVSKEEKPHRAVDKKAEKLVHELLKRSRESAFVTHADMPEMADHEVTRKRSRQEAGLTSFAEHHMWKKPRR